MNRDPRYQIIKELFESGEIRLFVEFFDHIPRSILSHYLHTNNNRMAKLIEQPKLLTLENVHDIALYFDIDYDAFLRFLETEIKMSHEEREKVRWRRVR